MEHVVAVVTQRDFGDLQFVGHAVQNAPAQAAAQAAHGLALRNDLFDDAVGVLRLDMKGHAELLQIGGQDVVGETGLLLVEVDGDQLKVDWRALLHFEQDVEHAVAVFAAGDADHDAVAFFDHAEIHDGLADLAAQALFQLVGFAFDFQRARSRIGRASRLFGFGNFRGNPRGIHGLIVAFSAVSPQAGLDLDGDFAVLKNLQLGDLDAHPDDAGQLQQAVREFADQALQQIHMLSGAFADDDLPHFAVVQHVVDVVFGQQRLCAQVQLGVDLNRLGRDQFGFQNAQAGLKAQSGQGQGLFADGRRCGEGHG